MSGRPLDFGIGLRRGKGDLSFRAMTAHGWVNRTLDDRDLDSFVDNPAGRLALPDRQALGAMRARINRIGVPAATEIEPSNMLFYAVLSRPAHGPGARKSTEVGYRTHDDFELDFGCDLTLWGPTNADA